MKHLNFKKKVFKYSIIVFFFLVLSIIVISSVSPIPIIIVKNHQPKATIVLAESASHQIQDVAKVLQDYIKRSTGALIPISNQAQSNSISIHIGLTSYVKSRLDIKILDDDAFILDGRNSNNYIIAGGSDWGTEFGVYSFLERFVGVVWLMPTQIGVDVPKIVTLTVPNKKIVDSPIYISRNIYPIFININNPLGTWGRFNRLRGRINFSHNLLNLYDPKEYFKTNPSFFGTADSVSSYKWQPDFSAKGIADTGAAKIIRYFKSNPTATSYSLGINDWRIFDQSPESLARRKGTKNYLGLEDVSDDYFRWANEVVKKVTKVFPDKNFGLLAYNNVAEPPSTSIGVAPEIVPFITYERMRWADSSLEIKGHEINKSWEEEANILGWYDYTYGLNYLVPRVWFHKMQNYLKWGAKHHVKYYFAELYPNWVEGPKSWLQAKLLWNPSSNVDSLLNVWYVSFAGEKAAPKLKAFYTIWESFWTKDIFFSKWNNNSGGYLPFNNYSYLDAIPNNYVDRADYLINAAYSLAVTEIQKKRLQKLLEMWLINRTAIDIWQQSDLPINKKNDAFINSVQFISLLNNLEQDSLYSPSILSIKMALKIK